MPPELLDLHASQDASGYESKKSWDVAVRYQDLKRFSHIPEKEKHRLRRRAIEGVLGRAREVMGNVVRPERPVVTDYRTFMEGGGRGEIEVLQTLDEELSSGVNLIEALRFDTRIEKESAVALVMDASLSMKGEKIALLAVSAAVVALCVPTKRLSLMGFDSGVRWVKRFGEEMPVEKVVERVLELPAGGFTNMEVALKETSATLLQNNRERANVIMITDGKYTEGADPTPLASRFRHLNVLKIGRDQAGRDLLRELSVKGGGKFFEARKIQELPKTMYSAMRSLLR